MPVYLVDYDAANTGNQFSDGNFTTLTLSKGYQGIRVGAFAGSPLYTLNYQTAGIDKLNPGAILAASFTSDAYSATPYASSGLRQVNVLRPDKGDTTLESALAASGVFNTTRVNIDGIDPEEEEEGTDVDSSIIDTPVQVAGVEGMGQLGAGTYLNPAISKLSVNRSYGEENGVGDNDGAGGHALAVDAYGNVYAWGYNSQGQLGNGTTDRYNKLYLTCQI